MKKFLSATTLALLLAASATAQYCAASVSNPCSGNEFLSHTVVGSITQNSACGLGYEDFSAQSTTVTPGGTLSVSATISNLFGGDQVDCWVDWNHNGTFDAGEHTSLTLSGSIASATVNVPAGALPGTTRLRLRLDYFPAANGAPCGASSYGNVEDYSVVVGAPTPPTYQVNQTNSTFTLNGTAGGPYSPATTNVTADNACFFGSVAVVWSSALVGLPWDFAIVPSLVAANAGGLTLNGPPTQVVNVDLTLPYPVLTFLNNLALNNAFPGAPIAFPFAPGAPTSAGGQLVVLDPASFDSVALSQGCKYNCTFAPGGITVPGSDDGANLYSLSDPALCLSTGSFSFYGTTYTQVVVGANGRLSFGSTVVQFDYVPTVTGTPGQSADQGQPFVGCWVDQNVTLNANGSIHLSTPAAGIVQLDYINDAFYAQASPQFSWNIQLDQNTTNMTMNGIGGFPLFVTGFPSNNMFMGISPGAAGGATDPGAASWGLGFNGGPGPTDMHYMYGQAGTILTGTGISSGMFINNLNGYDFVGS